MYVKEAVTSNISIAHVNINALAYTVKQCNLLAFMLFLARRFLGRECLGYCAAATGIVIS
jgi:hypothetical protein